MTATPPPASADDPVMTGAGDPVPLRLAAVEVVEPDGPFDPRTTLIKPSHFPSPFDAQGKHDYRAVTYVNGQPTGLRASFTDDAPTARTMQMARTLAGLLGTWYRFPDDVVLASFWNPGDVVDLGEAALRQAKLGYRAKTLTRLGAQFLTDPDIETHLRAQAGDPPALRAGLRALYGVGPATTGYLVFDVFKSLDELAHLPPWEAKILGRLLFDDPDTDPAHTITWCHDHWAPYTMLATHAVFETVFWHRATGNGPAWLDDFIRR